MNRLLAVVSQSRYDYFAWRASASIPVKITLAVGMAVITCLLAQVRIPLLPFSPVPITGQTFAVLMAGVLLGRKWGGLSMAIFAGLGLAGVPWLTGGVSGFGYTTGYMIGFVVASLFIGYVTDKKPSMRSFSKLSFLMVFSSLVLIYLPAVLWIGFWTGSVTGVTPSLITVLSIGVLPFIAGDIIKAVSAAALARGLLPKEQS